MEYIITTRPTDQTDTDRKYRYHLDTTDTPTAYRLAALADTTDPAAMVDLATPQAVLDRRRAILAAMPDHAPAAMRRLAKRAVWQAEDTAAAAYTAAARDIAKTTARNMVSREYTDTQWAIWTAAKRRDWDLPDLADMISTAVVGLVACTTDPAAALTLADTLDTYADTIATAPKHDPAAAVVKAQDKVSDHVPAEMVRDTLAAARRMSRLADTIATAATADNATDYTATAYLAGYRFVNNYLTDARAIRAAATPPCLRLSDLDTDPAAVDADALDPAAQAWLAAAWRAVLAALTPIRRRLVRLLYRGYSIRAAAATMHMHHSTAQGHLAAIQDTAAAVFSAARDTMPPALADTLAAVLDSAPTDTATLAAITRTALRGVAMPDTAAAVIAAAVDTMPPALATFYALTAAGMTERAAAAALGIGKGTAHRRAAAAAAHITAAVVAADIGVDPDHAAALTLADWTRAAAAR